MINRILLTGAGFTANFGTPLAADMSDSIFNNSDVQNNTILADLATHNYDYEDIYQKVMFTDNYPDEAKNILNRAVQAAYDRIDKMIMRNSNFEQTYFNLFNEFITRFAKRKNGSGLIFTLNQDLFLERKFNLDPVVNSIELPAIGTMYPNIHNGPIFFNHLN